ncbi:MAG: HisA/HisF-related TIM barrel protein [bacterium]|nr:HisA/HisF-related TIM barrel protein [bacterium]
MANLLIIPSVDLTQGQCVRRVMGVPGTEELYTDMSEHPVELAQLWRRENAKTIHVTDLDSWAGKDSTKTLDTVIAMQKAVDIPIELVTLQRSAEVYHRLLTEGVYRIALNVLALTDPDDVEDLLDEFSPSRVVFAARALEGDIDLGPGVGMVNDEEFINHVYDLGGKRLIYTEQRWEGALTGQDLETINRIAALTTMRITTAGGIASPEHLWELQRLAPPTLDSVVIGRALYENRFPCQAIWRVAEATLEPPLHASAMHEQQSSISKL